MAPGGTPRGSKFFLSNYTQKDAKKYPVQYEVDLSMGKHITSRTDGRTTFRIVDSTEVENRKVVLSKYAISAE